MSARTVVAPAASMGSGPLSAPDATPTTAPTVVTAVAEATANPRTEIRLTRFPSSIARLGDLADAIVPLALASPCSVPLSHMGMAGHGRHWPGGPSLGRAARCSGGIRRTLF